VQAPSSAQLRERVQAARERRRLRDASPVDHRASLSMTGEPAVSDSAWGALHDAYRAGAMTHRSGERVLAVAHTVADLAGEDTVSAEAVNTALALGGRAPAPTFGLAY
jgi:predicted ATPase with chaperone activity